MSDSASAPLPPSRSLRAKRRAPSIAAIVRKEALTEQRGLQIPFLVSLFVAVLVLADLTIIGFSLSNNNQAPWETGFYVFRVVSVLMGFGLGVILPIMAATAITGEKEKRTWDILRATGLTPGRIVLGKHIASLGSAVFMLLTAMPCFALVVIVGGVRPDQFLIALTLMLVAVAFWTAIGIWVSTQFQKSLGSIGTMIALYIAAHTIPLGMIISALGRSSGSGQPILVAAFLYPVLSAFIALPEQYIDVCGISVPLILYGVVFALLATFGVLRAAHSSLIEPDRDTKCSGRPAALGLLLMAALPYGSTFLAGHEFQQTFGFLSSTVFVALALLALPMTRPLSTSERVPGVRGFLSALLNPRWIFRARTASIPLFQFMTGCAILAAMYAGSRTGSSGDKVSLLAIGSVAVMQAATFAAWSALAFACTRRFGAPRLVSALVLFVMLFLIVTSFIPGLPHHIDVVWHPNFAATFANEFMSAISPAYPSIRFMNAKETSNIIFLTSPIWQCLLLGASIVIGRKVKK